MTANLERPALLRRGLLSSALTVDWNTGLRSPRRHQVIWVT